MNRENLNPFELYFATLQRARNNRYISGYDYRAELHDLSNESIHARAVNAYDKIRDDESQDYREEGECALIITSLFDIKRAFVSGNKSYAWAIDKCGNIAYAYNLSEWDVYAMFANTFYAIG